MFVKVNKNSDGLAADSSPKVGPQTCEKVSLVERLKAAVKTKISAIEK